MQKEELRKCLKLIKSKDKASAKLGWSILSNQKINDDNFKYILQGFSYPIYLSQCAYYGDMNGVTYTLLGAFDDRYTCWDHPLANKLKRYIRTRNKKELDESILKYPGSKYVLKKLMTNIVQENINSANVLYSYKIPDISEFHKMSINDIVILSNSMNNTIRELNSNYVKFKETLSIILR